MQWFNPKAWVAAVAGMSAFAANGDAVLVWQFSALYFAVCYVSIACWAYAGTFLRRRLNDPAGMRRFNRTMALLLAASATSAIAPPPLSKPRATCTRRFNR